MKKTSIQLFTLAVLVVSIFSFSACDDETPSPGATCTVAINNFSLGSSSFNSGASITGSVSLNETTSLDATGLRNMTTLYLSSDDTYDSGDTQLAAFTSAPVESGSQTIVSFDQIEIPNVASGQYYVIAQVHSQPCGNGETISGTSRSQSVTIN